MQTLVDYPGRQSASNPTAVADRDTGTIWIAYPHGFPPVNPQVDPHATFKREIIRSDNDGATWSKPEEMKMIPTFSPPVETYPTWGGSIQLRNGTLVMPGSSQKGDKSTRIGHVIYSDDHGETWKVGPGTKPCMREPQVVELADGSLMLNARKHEPVGYRVVATSRDGGATWSELRDDHSLVDPPCQGSILRYSFAGGRADKNRLLFAIPASPTERVNMTVRLSYDEGKTWPVSRTIHSGPSAYSCLVVLPEGTIGLLYECGVKYRYEKIAFARFNLEWLTEGVDHLTKSTDPARN